VIRPYEPHELAIIAMQAEHPDEEICGVFIERAGGFHVEQLENICIDKEHYFEIKTESIPKETSIFWHTHPGRYDDDGLSENDKWSARAWMKPMCVYVKRTGRFVYWQPDNYRATIENRPWCPVIFDCFALIRDALFEFFDVDVPDLDRTFLHASTGLQSIEEYFKPAGFETVLKSGIGRIALINYGGAKYVNHVALFVTESQILHQLRGCPSRVEFYGQTMRNATIYFVRHLLIESAITAKRWQYGSLSAPAGDVLIPGKVNIARNPLKAALSAARARPTISLIR
jgi:NlpC/P60 family